MFKILIVKTNEWYENLDKLYSGIFYLSLIFVPFILLGFFSGGVTYSFIWIFLVISWRLSYKGHLLIKDYKKMKNGK